MTTAEVSPGSANQIPFSSIPVWATTRVDAERYSRTTENRNTPQSTATPEDPDPRSAGTSGVIVAVGAHAHGRVHGMASSLPACVLICADDPDTGAQQLGTALDSATVGVRVHIYGPVGACLTLRAAAITAGLEDDEIIVEPLGSGPVDVFCAHCRTVSRVEASVDDIIDCSGCGRSLLVYYHLSRRTGAFLGFMADAETARTPGGSGHCPGSEES